MVEYSPNDEATRIDLGNLQQQSGDTEKAKQQIDAVLKANPNSKLGLEAAFKHYLAKGQWDQAQENVKKLQDAYPKEGLGFFLSGLAYQAEGKIDQSVAAFETALSRQPDYSRATDPVD